MLSVSGLYRELSKIFIYIYICMGLQNPRRHIPTKPKFEYPPPIRGCMLLFRPYCHVIYKHSNYLKNELKVINKPYSDDNNYLLWRF